MREAVLLMAILAFISACGPAETPPPDEDIAPKSTDRTVVDNAAGPVVPPAAADPGSALDGEWVLTAIDGEPLPEGLEAPTLRVSGNELSGFAGVNRYQGALSHDGRRTFGTLASTRMAGPPAAMELERRFLDTLEGTTGYLLITGDDLILATDANTSLSMRRSEPAP